jgi:large subunit ribosomal protein L10
MPNAKVLEEKKAIVATLTRKLGSKAGVLVDYSGITVAEDTEMRAHMRRESVEYSVIKNTLLRFAVKNAGLDGLDPLLSGTTALAVHSEDPVAPARIIKEYVAKFTDHFEIKGGFMDGKVLSIDEINALASIPPLPILRAQVLGTMLAPITSLAIVLKAIAEKDGGSVESAAADEVPAETPNEETPAEQAPAEETTATEAPAE